MHNKINKVRIFLATSSGHYDSHWHFIKLVLMKHYRLEPANYSDYRDFLKTRFEELKKRNAKYSLNFCARSSKISKSLLQFIFSKKRHLGLDRMPPLAKTLKLTSEEEYFIYLMICRKTSRNPEVQNHFENILNRIRHEFINSNEPEPQRSHENDKQLFLNYHLMALFALVRLKNFREDARWIKENLLIPNLTEELILLGLKKLEANGFIFRDENNCLKARPETLWRPDAYDPSGQKVFTRGAEGIAELMQTPERYRPSVYMSMSLAFDEKRLLEAEKFMIDIHHHLVKLSKNCEEPNAVAQIGNFFITVARLN